MLTWEKGYILVVGDDVPGFSRGDVVWGKITWLSAGFDGKLTPVNFWLPGTTESLGPPWGGAPGYKTRIVPPKDKDYPVNWRPLSPLEMLAHAAED